MPIVFGCISRKDRLRDIEDPIINTAKELYNSSLEVIEPQINTIIGYSEKIITSNTKEETVIVYTNTPKALDSDSTQITLTTSKIEITVDHFNTKRVYFYQNESYLAFSTSLRHLLKTIEKLGLEMELNYEATIFYLATGIPPFKDTLIEKFRKTIPGEKIIIKTDNQEKRSIYRDFINYEKPSNLTEKYLEKIYESMKEAVRKRVENNEKPAIMLSGGIDSTLLAALITKFNGDLTAINMVIPNLYSEYETASEIAEYLNIPIIKFEIKNKDKIIEEYMEASKYIEEPTSRSAFLSYYKIIRELEKRGYKEIYTGLGGATLSLERTTPNKFDWDQKPIVRIFRNKVIQRATNLICKLREMGVRIPRRMLIQILLGYISGQGENSLEGFITGTYLDNYFNYKVKTIREASRIVMKELKRLTKKLELMAKNDKLNAKGFSVLYRLINHDLMTINSISSKLNLKSKTPYLDTRLISTIYRIPSKLKYHPKINKYLLIKLAKKYKLLPESYLKKVRKRGMGQITKPLIVNEELSYEILKGIDNYTGNTHLAQLIKEEMKSRNKKSKLRIIYLWLWLKAIRD